MPIYTPDQLRDITAQGEVIETELENVMETMRLAASQGFYFTRHSDPRQSIREGLKARLEQLGYVVTVVNMPPSGEVEDPNGITLRIDWSNDPTP